MSLKRDTADHPECWRKERDHACLRIEPNPGELHVFSYHHFVSAHLSRAAAGDTLRLFFTTTEVIVSGRNLIDIARALQDLAVAWLTTTPRRAQSLRDSEAAVITAIEIK